MITCVAKGGSGREKSIAEARCCKRGGQSHSSPTIVFFVVVVGVLEDNLVLIIPIRRFTSCGINFCLYLFTSESCGSFFFPPLRMKIELIEA